MSAQASSLSTTRQRCPASEQAVDMFTEGDGVCVLENEVIVNGSCLDRSSTGEDVVIEAEIVGAADAGTAFAGWGFIAKYMVQNRSRGR